VPEAEARLAPRVSDDPGPLRAPLDVLVDAGVLPPVEGLVPELARRGTRILSPLSARLLFGQAEDPGVRREELLGALSEIAESLRLGGDAPGLFERLLEGAVGATDASGGSLMLVDESDATLRIHAAVGLERELWAKIRVAPGEGIAGRVLAEGRALKVRGAADPEQFPHVRPRHNALSCLCVPLLHEGRAVGVLSLHDEERADAFDDDDLAFAEALGRLGAEIAVRAREQQRLRRAAARHELARAARRALAGEAPLIERLQTLCAQLEASFGGPASVFGTAGDELELLASSLAPPALGDAPRLRAGAGLAGRAARGREALVVALPDGSLGAAAVPLRIAERRLGVLEVEGGVRGSFEGDAEAAADALEEVAELAADALQRAEHEARLRAGAERAAALHDAALRLAAARERRERLRLAVSEARRLTGAAHAVLRLRDAETGRHTIRAYAGDADRAAQERLFQLDRVVVREALRAEAPRLVAGLPERPDTAGLARRIGAALVVPLRAADDALGVLAAYADVEALAAFDAADLEVLARFGAAVAHAFAPSLERGPRRAARVPSTPADLHERVAEALGRARRFETALVIVTCRIEVGGLAEPGLLLDRLARILALRPGVSAVARTAESELSALLEGPGPTPARRVAELARIAADEAAKLGLSEAEVPLAFGWASFPEDGDDVYALRRRAARPRLRAL
jgi:Nif-specific regulatory protein